jgi:phenylalanyl-tRNA synthetase beta chain
VKVLLSWIREFVDVQESAEDIGRLMSVRGLALEGLEPDGSDAVMDFDVTANRPDCLSIRGIAREIATAYQSATAEAVALQTSEMSTAGTIPVAIDDPDLCARYVGAPASVKVGPSPTWMQDRLAACGIRPISNIVDVTNYVLLELGHPMHAFDRAKLAGDRIVVRRARPGESITTLDGKKRTLTPEMLVIADAERAQAIGGVMGGLDSEVTAGTTQIVFEAAWFTPSSVRATSKALGLKTEASTRFERGMDRAAARRAMTRALELLAQIGAGEAIGTITDTYPRPWETRTLHLGRGRIGGLLGMEVPDDAVVRILTSLGFGVSPTSDGWDVVGPPWRIDVNRPVDLIEEVGRHYGYEHLPSTFPAVQQAPPPSDPRIARDRRVRAALLGMGFSEAITFAFIEASAADPYLLGQQGVTIANPLSEKFAVMRPSLLPGLVDALSHNRRHGRPDVRLFEIGTRFSPAGETRGAAFAWMGLGTSDHWSGAQRAVDFSDIKGVVEQLAALAEVDVTFAEARAVFLVEGRAAEIRVNGRAVGVMGQLSPAMAESRGLAREDETYVAEIDLDAVTAASPLETRRARPLPRHPFVVRDVSILVADTLSAETVRGTIRTAAPDTLIQVREFDRYQGKGIPDGKVSLSYRLTFQSPDRTLTDEEVQAALQRILEALTRDLQAVQR